MENKIISDLGYGRGPYITSQASDAVASYGMVGELRSRDVKMLDPKYETYMKQTFPQGVYAQWNKCVEFVAKMHIEFPELIKKQGYVYSHVNIDNKYGSRYPYQIPHFWLETSDGVIVDPTVLQFAGIGKLHYVDIGDQIYCGKCSWCAQMCFGEPKYDDEGQICGNCHWTNKEETACSNGN